MSAHPPRSAAEAKKRQVRKGTHSCWECRRRKIRCQFASEDAVNCVPCQRRGATCRSQEFDDESRAEQPPPDRRLAQRLARLEELMEKLVERMTPDASVTTTEPDGASGESSASPCGSAQGGWQQPANVLDRSLVDDAPIGLLFGLGGGESASQSSPSMPTPESDRAATNTCPGFSAQPHQYAAVCTTLLALFPGQRDINTIVRESLGDLFVTTLFHSRRDIMEGKCEPPNSVAVIPPATSHPSVLARRLLQLSICMQQLPPTFDRENLVMKSNVSQVMTNIVSTVINLVTSNDEFIGTAEGLECLILQGIWQANAGNLRKAWLSHRRALSLGQLVGIDRENAHALKSADPALSPSQQASSGAMWYRILFCDRYFSLVLGLPIGSPDNSFASDRATARDMPIEKLEKFHTVIAARIADRNSNKTPQAFGITQAIDYDLETAARGMDPGWWAEPSINPFSTPMEMAHLLSHLALQIHHYSLLVLLHLPYMLRDPSESRYDYSRTTCVSSSREVLRRFITFRSLVCSAFSCRHVDYSALITAMTLQLSYLGQPPGASTTSRPLADCVQQQEDRRLVEVVRERMEHVAVLNHDKLSQESADMVGRLMVVLDAVSQRGGDVQPACRGAVLHHLQLAIPYLGTVSIHPSPSARTAAAAAAAAVAATPCAEGLRGLAAVPPNDAVPTQYPTEGVGEALGQPMDFNNLSPSFTQGTENVPSGMYMELEPQGTDTVLFPDLMAESDDWVFQGVDTTYWSLLNGGMGPG